MSFKKWLAKTLTPKNTEEVKPNLFIQAYNNPDSLMARLDKTIKGHNKEIRYPKYRHIFPAAWNNKINWAIMIFGAHPIKSLFVFLLIIYMAWSYHHDTQALVEWNNQIMSNFTARMQLCSQPVQAYNPLSQINFSSFNLTA